MSVRFAHARVREDEHAIGVRLQQALLPAQLLEHPAAQLAARYQTGSDLLHVGGDCAGHPPPLVVSVDGQTDWLEGGRSTPIGSVSLASSRPDASHRLKPSDVLILYSDGLVERRRESISVGLARLEASARTVVDELCERLKDELTTTSTNDDDAVLLSLRFSPVTAQLFQRRIPADARELARTRAAIRSWLRGRRDPASVGHRLLLTVGEALTNAIEHAYDGQRPGVIDLSISDGGDDALHVEVRDHGRWRGCRSARTRLWGQGYPWTEHRRAASVRLGGHQAHLQPADRRDFRAMNDPLGRIETDTEPDGLRLSLFGEVLALSHLKDLPAQLIGETDGWAPVSEPGADLSGR